jgi:hypothetical protein
MSMRDQIAEIIEHNAGVNGYGFVINGPQIADAILEALPDMIAPLAWEEGIAVCPVTKNRYSAGWYDAGDDCTELLIDGTYHCGDMSMTELKAAANTHHRAAIMAAFTGENA